MPDVNGVKKLSALDAVSRQNIADLIERNAQLGGTAIENFDWKQLYAHAATGMGIRSAHGAPTFTFHLSALAGGDPAFLPFSNTTWTGTYRREPSLGASNTKIKACWLSYAKSAATAHAGGGIPAGIEFNGSGGARVVFLYIPDLVLYTPDHYTTWFLVVDSATDKPLKTMP